MEESTHRYPLPSAAALADLRWLLDDARARATVAIPPARRSAVIALDGAIESALWLVARAAGKGPGRKLENFQELLNAVREAFKDDGVTWREPGLMGILQLRQARNGAQHAAVRPDPHQLAEWVDATVAFVDGLLSAAFGVTSDEAGLALAVDDRELRTVLQRAEQAARQNDAREAFILGWSAFSQAVQRWTEGPVGGARLIGPLPYMHLPDADVRAEIDALRAFQDVHTFAPDLGEYLALRRTHELLDRPAFTPTDDDAYRAIRFAATWIARWEAFGRGYPDERWHGALAELEPPSDHSVDGPAIVDFDVTRSWTEHGLERWVIVVQLANVPERARGEWGLDLRQCFADAAIAQGAEVRLMRMSPLAYDGRLSVEIEPGADAAQFALVLREAVRLADESHSRRSERQAEHEREASQRFEMWSSPVREGSDGVLDVSPVRRETRADGEHYVLDVQITLPVTDVERLQAASALRNAGGVLAGLGAYRGALEVEAVPLSSEDVEHVREAAARTAEWLGSQRAERQKSARRFDSFVGDLRLRMAAG